jgi:hypothetical protein
VPKVHKKMVLTMMIVFFVTSLLYLVLKSESKGLIFGALSYMFIFDRTKITKYDYIFVGSLVIGSILKFIDIFTKNIYLYNIWSVFICGLVIFVFLKKSDMNHDKR